MMPGDGPRAEMWAYLDPEDANRVTYWATGLSILVSLTCSGLAGHF